MSSLVAAPDLRATVVYGLVWFDDRDRVRHEVLDKEPWALESEFPLRVVTRDDRGVWSSAYGPALGSPLDRVLADGLDAVLAGRVERRFGDVADRRAHFGLLLGVFVALAVAGIAVAVRVSDMSVRPLEATARVDAWLLEVALHNLLHNAERHWGARDGTGVRVKVRETMVGPGDRRRGRTSSWRSAGRARHSPRRTG